jgi:hypothetical protein
MIEPLAERLSCPTERNARRETVSRKTFWPVVCLLLCILAARQIYTALIESETIDEGVHLTAGYSYWKTHDFRLTPSHPPFAELISALPLIPLNPEFNPDPAAWQDADEYRIAKQFIYMNRVPADTMLFAGRLMTILVTSIFGVAIAWWTRRFFGRPSALFAVLLFSLNPTVIAHGHYITTDMMVSGLILCSCMSWLDYLQSGSRSHLFRTGMLTALTFASKFSGLILFPLMFLMYIAWRWLKPTAPSSRQSWKAFSCAMFLVPFLVVYSMFFFDTRSVLQDPRLGPRLANKTGLTHALAGIPIPAYYYARGVQVLLRDMKGGHYSYLMGNSSTHGSWMYFPVTFLVKTSVAMLLLIVLCIGLIARKLYRKTPIPVIWILLAIPPIGYFLVSLTSSMNIGVRHLLPVYPFLFVLTSAILLGERRPGAARVSTFAAILLGMVMVVESASIHPDYLAYFNVLAGGPQNGPRYLIDSNLDWGQDLKKLRSWTLRHPGLPLCLNYSGRADPEYYGIQYKKLESMKSPDEVMNADCVVAVSAHLLFGTEAEEFRLLRDVMPDDRIGYSIYVYDFRKNDRSRDYR